MEGKNLRQLWMICTLIMVCLLAASSAWAVNSVVVVGQDQLAPNSSVDIRVKITNDEALATIACPLVFRSDSVGGTGALTAFTDFEIKWRERLPAAFGGTLADLIVNNTYGAEASTNGFCKSDKPGGFYSPICATDTAVTDTGCGNLFDALPIAIMLQRNKIFAPSLAAGADAEGSILLRFQLNEFAGCFIIDTTCTNPANHLLFSRASNFTSIFPSFTKGRVCVGIEECANTGFGAPVVISPEDGVGGARTQEFVWQKVQVVDGLNVIDPVSYTVEVDTSSTFANPILTQVTSGPDDTAKVITLPQGIIDVFWRVRANGDNTTTPPACPGVNSEMRAYTICDNISLGIPELIAPEADTSGPNAATFQWGSVAGATSYTFQIDYTPNGSFSADFDTTVTGQSVTVTLPASGSSSMPYANGGSLAAGAQDTTVQWRVRANQGGCNGAFSNPFTYTDVKLVSSEVLPNSYALDQNYPNPFNASTIITFTNSRAGNVKLEVFNILGQSMITLVDGFKPVGVYSVDWSGVDRNGHEVPSGMYFYRFSTNGYTEVKKMTLLK